MGGGKIWRREDLIGGKTFGGGKHLGGGKHMEDERFNWSLEGKTFEGETLEEETFKRGKHLVDEKHLGKERFNWTGYKTGKDGRGKI